jgi:hypothetical protein
MCCAAKVKEDDLVPKRLAVFVSGSGSNMQMIHQACISGHTGGEIVVRGSTPT